MVARFWLLYVVDLISVVVRAAVHGLVLFIPLGNGSICHNVEARLCLSNQIPILVFFQAYVLLLQLLLRRLVALVDGLGMGAYIEAFGHYALLLAAFATDVHLGRPVEFTCTALLSVLSCIGGRVIEVVGVLLAIVGDCLRVFFACSAS